MNSIPLIKGNTPQEINTSIIALKKALSELEAQDRLLQGTDKGVQDKIKQINELIEGINTHLTAIDSQITALQPVDTVTSGNMHSVTSNAVAKSLDVVNLGGYLGQGVWQGEMITDTYPPRLPGGIIKNYDVYNAGGPYTYGQLISFGGLGATQIFLGWNASQTEVGQDVEMLAFMRSWRDNQNGWTAWKRFAFI